MLQIGTILANGRYRIEEYIASGGFGNTYLAKDISFNENVAIKELFIKGVCGRNDSESEVKISLTDNQRAFSAHRKKFRKEACRLHKLLNSHIVRVLDLFDENGTSYYVMDYVEGESLSARLKRTRKPMTEKEVLTMLPQVLDALDCVHSEGIWHLDLKPSNIMINAKGNIVLIDFGASKQVKNANGDSLSTSSAMAYTQGYAPSEQMEQSIDKFGPWTDLYALGATMFNLLTMQKPPSPSDIDEDPNKAILLPKSISKKTEELIFWLMKPNRKMRPQSVIDVKQFLVETSEVTESHLFSAKEKDADNDETIVRKINTAVNNISQQKEKTPTNTFIKYIIPASVAIIALSVGLAFRNYHIPEKEFPSTEVSEEMAVRIMYVKDMAISVEKGPNNMRRYLYTGELADTIGALPNGKGVAKFPKYGSIPPSTYEGLFTDGICEDYTGTATITFDSGDKFIGSFEGGFYSEGKYILSDKSYFKGTFKNGAPYNGKWYNADDSFSANVVNGMETS